MLGSPSLIFDVGLNLTDPAKKQFAEALLAFTDAFNIAILIYSL